MPSARSPKASFARAASVDRCTGVPASQRIEGVEGRPRVRTGEQRLADERLDDLDAGIERSSHLARAVDERQAGRVARRAGRAGGAAA